MRTKKRPAGFSDATVDLIIGRDKWSCAWCGKGVVIAPELRGMYWQIHHRRPRAAGGTSLDWVNLPANGLLLHPHCHAEVESNRTRALALGFLVRTTGWADAVQVPIRHAVHGPVHLLNDGTVKELSEPLFKELIASCGQTQGEGVLS